VNRDSIIKGLAVLAAVVLVLFIGYAIVRVMLNISRPEAHAESGEAATLDENTALKATLDSLEITWQEVQNHEFRTGQDPLHLGRVLKDFTYAQSKFAEVEEEERFRLTATVIDEHPKAIIKFNGKSHVVQAGGMLDNIYRVVSIEKKQVILEGAGGRLILTNKPLRQLEKTGGETDYSNSDSDFENY
jgi:hypothetical protein